MCLFCLFSVIISCPILYFNFLVSPRQVGFAYFRFSSLVLHLHCTLSILFLFCYILCFSLRLLCIYSFYHLLHPSAVALLIFTSLLFIFTSPFIAEPQIAPPTSSLSPLPCASALRLAPPPTTSSFHPLLHQPPYCDTSSS